MKEKKRIKTKIGLWYVVKSEAGYMEENTREGRIRSMSKELVGCFQDVVVKKKFMVQF